MKTKIYIDGSEGTTGLRIFERMARRDDVEFIKIDPELRKDPTARAKCINASDITFLCLPGRGSGSRVAGFKRQRAHNRRVHRAPHRARLGIRLCRAVSRPPHRDCKRQAHRQSGLSRDGLYIAGISAG